MDLITINAKPRETGKKAVHAVRRAEEVPCILYGADMETQIFQVPELTLKPLIFTNQFHRVEITLDGKSYECILKAVDFDPVSDKPIHADFQMLVEGEMLTLNVPVHYVGESIGVLEGGTPQEFVHEISVRCLPKHIPDHIDVDISHLNIGDSLLVRDLELENITINFPEDQALISVIQPREIIEPEIEELEVEEGEEVEEGKEVAEGAEGEASEGGGDERPKKKSDSGK
ncbi:MAG: 50S ribosomal protein L25 [Bacteroidetes bacterium]|nr:50S ribosomal protein L25 [Bacteroidota bacterium]